MRDRMIELIKNSNCVSVWDYHTDDFKEPDPIETLADYLLENGVIVPPCKVGETLYLVQIDYEGDYFMTTIVVSSKITLLSILRAYEEKTIIYMSTDKNKAEEELQTLKGGMQE